MLPGEAGRYAQGAARRWVARRACGPSLTAWLLQVVLEVKGEPQLRTLSASLTAAGVAHKLWTEQPEDFATCLATKPYPKNAVAAHFKKLQLCK